jgi:uncharacterized protein
MRIELESLNGAKGKFAHEYAPGELVIEDERITLVVPPTVSGEIRQDGNRVKVNGRVIGRIQLECDRCLKPVEFPVNSKFSLEYVTAKEYEALQTGDLSKEELDLDIFDGESIDVDELVTEELLLAAPDHLVCNEACKGMCLVCGINRNVADCTCETVETDPRWAGLKELVDRGTGE